METRDHTVNIRDRYPDTDFDLDVPNGLGDTVSKLFSEFGIDPYKFKYEESSCSSRRPQVEYYRLRVGDLLWWNDIESDNPTWHEVVVTHLYGGVVFLECTDGYKPEFWLPKQSVGFYLSLYPKKVVIPKGTKFSCDCPLTEFVSE